MRAFFLLVLSVQLSLAQSDWKLRIDEDSIRVWTGHQETSKIKTIRSEFTLRASRDEFLRELMLIERYPEWQYKALKCHTLQKVSAREVIYYCEVEAPWPVTNRDMVIRLQVHDQAGSADFRVTTHSDTFPVPLNDDLVRVPMSTAEWSIRVAGPRLLKIKYTVQVDPGGSVPAWVINLVAAQAPFQTFKNLKRRLE